MRARTVKILYNKEAVPGYRRLGVSWDGAPVAPGQFVMLRVSDGLDPLLRRPFGVYRVIGAPGKKGRSIEILYRVVGKGTRILSNREAGEEINCLGPLGNGFPSPGASKDIILVAGGMGIAPLYMLADRLKKGTLLFGVRTKAEAVFAGDFKKLGLKVRVSSEDGSTGKKGLVTGLLEEEAIPGSVIYACGPVGMLKAVSAIACKTGARCYVSLERTMACGIGVCLGCAVKSKTHEEGAHRAFRMVCSEGPVFRSTEIDWGSL